MEQVPCDPEFQGTDACEQFRRTGRCFMDCHHIYHPRSAYRKPIEREFRNLDENKVYSCRNMHNLDHAIFAPPDKPDLEIMKLAIEEERNRRGEVQRPE